MSDPAGVPGGAGSTSEQPPARASTAAGPPHTGGDRGSAIATPLPRRSRAVGDPAGRLEAIWIKRSHGGVMDARASATLQAKKGIVGNADWGGWRQVTIIEKERWEAITNALEVQLDPATRRANLMVSGIDLESSRDKTLAVGGVRIKLVNETRPCNLMDEALLGLKDALEPEWGGGAFGYVVDDGEISVGDEVCWVEYEELT